nr:immunoglobulin light chain junction region [Mus musculus]NSL97046.1 immunoglobulin light chain junction region [Mus musculus]NSL97374.1 immunoglobulin light chain junction region [Mus musculus]NSL97882.1 immunoglobulin light chain junction region [Mus musculus]NSL98107.1 immunoglobulin light chain junction region [Mus musculus]
CQQVDTLPYTF